MLLLSPWSTRFTRAATWSALLTTYLQAQHSIPHAGCVCRWTEKLQMGSSIQSVLEAAASVGESSSDHLADPTPPNNTFSGGWNQNPKWPERKWGGLLLSFLWVLRGFTSFSKKVHVLTGCTECPWGRTPSCCHCWPPRYKRLPCSRLTTSQRGQGKRGWGSAAQTHGPSVPPATPAGPYQNA